MGDCSEFLLKKLCCTCLSRDRNLSQLCRLKEGVNRLYLLLSQDSEAYREGFYKDTASWYICWECWAVMKRISNFQSQACLAQRQLSDIVEGRTDSKLLNACLSHLTYTHKSSFDQDIVESDSIADNFVDCGFDFKMDSDEDLPLSLLHNHLIDDQTHPVNDIANANSKECTSPFSKKGLNKSADSFKKKKKVSCLTDGKDLCDNKYKKFFSVTIMDDLEMNENRLEKKSAVADMQFKCESCIKIYDSQMKLDQHNLELHTEKEKHKQCDICLVYIKRSMLTNHRNKHYHKYKCQLCEYVTYTMEDVLMHLNSIHARPHLDVSIGKRKGSPRTCEVHKPFSKSRKNKPMSDKRTVHGYLCLECNKYFENKNQRWKHIQRQHREGYKCATCGKRFAFKNNLSRHELMHKAPPPREECPVCHKMVRVDLKMIHSRIHTQRDRFTCVECDKCFVSRASYEHHLKYTQTHAAIDILKYKCSMCDKGYRSRGELRDHVNYQHMGKTQHKCPICGKALATRRCITRHVRRAHDGVKENPKDKICQQCGKAFRDKKGLREHEFIHTGERPLSCEICGCTFRQSASLYTHRKRVHKIFPSRKNVTLVEEKEQKTTPSTDKQK